MLKFIPHHRRINCDTKKEYLVTLSGVQGEGSDDGSRALLPRVTVSHPALLAHVSSYTCSP